MEKYDAWDLVGVHWWNTSIMKASNGAFFSQFSPNDEPDIINMGADRESISIEPDMRKNPLTDKDQKGNYHCRANPCESMSDDLREVLLGASRRVITCLKAGNDFR